MTSRERNLLVGLCYFVFAGFCWMYFYASPLEYFRSKRASLSDTSTDQRLKEYAQVRIAERIHDPVESCLAYPDPPEFKWDPAVVKALCALRGRTAMSWNAIEQAVDAGHTEQLDQTFEKYLTFNYESGQHGFLCWVLSERFAHASADVQRVTNRWVEQDPHSAYALAARGTYYVAAAWQARGTKFAYETSAQQMAQMREFAARAREDLEEALRLNPKLIAAYDQLLGVAKLRSDHELLASSASNALKLDPAESWIYNHWEDAVEPKWGGSEAQMQEIAAQAQQHANENPLLKRIATRATCNDVEMARLYPDRLVLVRESAGTVPSQCFVNEAASDAESSADYWAALSYGSQAYRFTGGEKYRFRRDWMLQTIGHGDWALEDIDAAIQAEPANIDAREWRGWIQRANSRFADAEKTFRDIFAVDPENRVAGLELVEMYTTVLADQSKAQQIADAVMAKNARNPRAWLLQSLIDMKADPDKFRADTEKYLALVDQHGDDSYEQRDINRAKERLRNLDARQAAARRH